MIRHLSRLAVAVVVVAIVASWTLAKDPPKRPGVPSRMAAETNRQVAGLEREIQGLRNEAMKLEARKRELETYGSTFRAGKPRSPEAQLKTAEQDRAETAHRNMAARLKQLEGELARERNQSLELKTEFARERHKLTDEVFELARKLEERRKAPRQQHADKESQLKIFCLKKDKAETQARVILQLFGRDKMHVVPHLRTNTLIVVGPDTQLRKIEELLLKLEESPTVAVDTDVQQKPPLLSIGPSLE